MESYFRTWKLSLYRIPHERIIHLKAQDFEDDMYIDEANHTAAVLLLKRENILRAEKFIEYAISKDETSIHAWCNKGLYHLMESPPRIQDSQKAKSKMETLRQLEGPLKTARVEYAEWLFQKDKSDDAKRQALEMMEADLGSENRRQNEKHNFSHHYLYAKVLLITANVPNDETSPDGVLQKFVDQLTVLASSHDPKFEIQIWLFLADVQNYWRCEKFIKDERNLSEFRNVTGCDNVNLETCVYRIKELTTSNTDLQVKSNFYARVGELLRQVAKKNNDETERKEMLEIALEISEIADVPLSCNDRKPLICARILLDLWAIEYWKCNRGEVKEAYRKHNLLPTRKEKGTADVWCFLAEEYYRTKLKENDTTRPLLEKAKEYLIQRVDSRRSHFHPEYLRVLMLLGESQDSIKEEFDLLYQSAEFDLDRGCILLHRGRFLETIGRHSEAAKHYKNAKVILDKVSELRRKNYNLKQLENGLKRLQTD